MAQPVFDGNAIDSNTFQTTNVWNQSVTFSVTAGDLIPIQSVVKGFVSWRPVRYFLSRRYRAVALIKQDQEQFEDWR